MFIGLLLQDEIYQVIKTIDFTTPTKPIKYVPISQSTIQRLVPTIDDLLQNENVINRNGLAIYTTQHLNYNGNVPLCDENDNFIKYEPMSKSKAEELLVQPDPTTKTKAKTDDDDDELKKIEYHPILAPSKPVHYGFFDNLPQDELTALYNALDIRTVVDIPGQPSPLLSSSTTSTTTSTLTLMGKKKPIALQDQPTTITPDDQVINLNFLPVLGGAQSTLLSDPTLMQFQPLETLNDINDDTKLSFQVSPGAMCTYINTAFGIHQPNRIDTALKNMSTFLDVVPEQLKGCFPKQYHHANRTTYPPFIKHNTNTPLHEYISHQCDFLHDINKSDHNNNIHQPPPTIVNNPKATPILPLSNCLQLIEQSTALFHHKAIETCLPKHHKYCFGERTWRDSIPHFMGEE